MKKTFIVLVAAGFAVLTSCGPSKEEQERAAKMHQDSLDEARRLDSIATAEAAARQQAMQDSVVKADSLKMVAMQDSMAKMKEASNKPKPKAKPKSEIKTETPKVGYKKPGAK